MCHITAAQIQADGKAVGEAILQIANLPLVQADPTLASELKLAAQGIIDATSNWQDGSPTVILEDAENAVVVALNLIPLTAPYASLVAIAFAGLNLLIANTKTQPQQAAASSSLEKASIVLHAAKANLTGSPWFGQADIKIHHNNLRKGFEDAWNADVAAHPDFGAQPITL